jgi:hypothetical protein
MQGPGSSVNNITAIVDLTMIIPSLHTDMNITVIPQIISTMMIIITSPTN